MPPSDASPGERGKRSSAGARVAWVLVAIGPVALLSYYVSGLHVGAIRGTVGIVDNIDAPKKSWHVVPAEAVDILIVWRAREGGKYPHSPCVRTVLTRTNAQGEYSVDSWWLAPAWPLRTKGRVEVYASKPGYLPLVDRGPLGRYRSHSHILGPPAVNPWTGQVLPDEDPLRPTRDSNCPDVERL